MTVVVGLSAHLSSAGRWPFCSNLSSRCFGPWLSLCLLDFYCGVGYILSRTVCCAAGRRIHLLLLAAVLRVHRTALLLIRRLHHWYQDQQLRGRDPSSTSSSRRSPPATAAPSTAACRQARAENLMNSLSTTSLTLRLLQPIPQLLDGRDRVLQRDGAALESNGLPAPRALLRRGGAP
jgi:hypothetical protein